MINWISLRFIVTHEYILIVTNFVSRIINNIHEVNSIYLGRENVAKKRFVIPFFISVTRLADNETIIKLIINNTTKWIYLIFI